MGQLKPTVDPLVQTYANTITASDAFAHLSFLADDMLEGRETGERGQRLAARYIRTHFMKLGLAPGVPTDDSYFQIYYLSNTEVKSAQMQIGKKAFEFGKGFFSLGSSLPDTFNPDFLFAADGSPSLLEGLDFTGKTALLQMPESDKRLREKVGAWSEAAEEIKKAGAAAICMVIPDNDFNTLARYAGRKSTQVRSKEEVQSVPVIFLSQEMGTELLTQAKAKPQKIQEKLEAGKLPKLNFNKLDFSYSADIDRADVPCENVLGYLEGTDKKEELIVITAHYDHIGLIKRGEAPDKINNGADDDGSGTTAVLELAEAFAEAAKAGNRPRRSILFMTVSGEEKGLLGSAYYTDHPIYPLENTVANFNIDMIGRIGSEYIGKPDSAKYIYLIGSDKLSSELHAISEKANEEHTQLTLDYKYNDENDPNRFYYRSDHYNFAKNGIPVIFYFNGTHADYHRPSDEIDKIHFEKLVKITQLVFATAWEVANRDERIKVDSNKK